MREKLITTAEIMSWGPCPDWPEDRVSAYVGDGMTIEQFLACDLAPRDLEWVLIRREVLDNNELSAIVGYCPAVLAQGAMVSLDSGLEMSLGSDLEMGLEMGLDSNLDTGLEMGLDTGLDTGLETGLESPTAPPQIDLVALASWPDPMGALSEARQLSPTLTVDALRMLLAGAQ